MTYTPAAPERDATEDAPTATRRGLGCAFEIVETLVLTLIIYVVIHNFIAQPFEVRMSSMTPTIVEHEYVLIDKISPRFADYQRGDIIVFQPPDSMRSGSGAPFIKRVIGLPGDRVELEDGRVLINGVELDEPYLFLRRGEPEPTEPSFEGETSWLVPDGSLFVMGDHRSASADSREFGPIDVSTVLGRALLRYWPFDTLGPIQRPEYPELAST